MNKLQFFKQGTTKEQRIEVVKAVAGQVAIQAALLGSFIGASALVSKVRQNRHKKSTVTVLFRPTVEDIDTTIVRLKSEHEYKFGFPDSTKKVTSNEAIREAGLQVEAIKIALKEYYEEAYPKAPDVVKVVHHSSDWIVVIK